MDALSKATNGFISGDTSVTMTTGYLSGEAISEAERQVSILGTATFGKTSSSSGPSYSRGLSYKEGGRHHSGSYAGNDGVKFAEFVDQRGKSYPQRSMYYGEALRVVPIISLLAARNELFVRPHKEGIQVSSRNSRFKSVLTRGDWAKIVTLLSGSSVKDVIGEITAREDPLLNNVDAHLELLEGQIESLFSKFDDRT